VRPSDLIVSNVRGPEEPLEGELGRVANFVSVGHLKNVLGLNITVWSYADHLNFALYACPVAVPDIEAVGRHLQDSFRELHLAARELGFDVPITEASRAEMPAVGGKT